MKHTPRPWHAKIVPPEHHDNGDITYHASTIEPTGISLCRAGGVNEADIANLKLAAAAPELLDALDGLLNDLESLARDFSICDEIAKSSYGKAARSAIKKATS